MAGSRRVTTAIAVALGALTLVACDTRPQTNGVHPPATTVFQFSWPELRVYVLDRGDVTIERGSDRTVEVTRQRFGEAQGRTNRLSLENSDLWLDDGCPGGGRGACEDRYVLKVPPKVNLVLTVATGETRISGLDGRVELQADRGDVWIDGVAGDLKVSARDGEVSLNGLTSRQVEVTAEHGDVDATFAAPPTKVDFRVLRGDVQVDLPNGQERYRLDAQPDNGELHSDVDSDATSERVVRVVAGAGDITLTRDRG